MKRIAEKALPALYKKAKAVIVEYRTDVMFADLSEDVRNRTRKIEALFAQFFAYYRGGTELYELEGEAVVEEED